MQALIDTLKAWQLHPFVDHFTVSLIVVAVLVDIVASILPSRLWLRYMALTLLVLGTLAAFGSRFTGGLEFEAHRVGENLTEPAKEVLRDHARLGNWLPFVFAALLLWRLLLQFVGFAARTRPIYIIISIIAAGFILYQGFLGGDLVYYYGVGTLPMRVSSPTESPIEPAPAPISASPIPTVFVPTPTPIAAPTPTAAASAPTGTPAPTASSAAPEEASPTPSSDSSTKNL